VRRRATLTLAAAAAAAVVSIGAAGSAVASTGAKGPRTPEQARMAAIVHAWSARLDRSDYEGIAQLFAVPAIIIQPPYEYRLVSRRQIALWHAGLPCAGTVVAITFKGHFATAVFRLANRGSTKCDAPGSLAAARFEIVKGKIVSWVQVPVPKGAASGAPVA
jgi:hypothetical protein